MNSRTLLPYLDDEQFLRIVQEMMAKGEQALAQAEENFTKNVIDPFLMLFEMGNFGLDVNAWIRNEKTRQSQKTLSNQVGIFHQKIIGALDGWIDLGTNEILDVVCDEKRVIAEIKNKFNTVKGSDLIKLYNDMKDMVRHKTQKYHNYTAYHVAIIPQKAGRYDECFVPSNRATGQKASADEHIRRIDGASFYALATGIDDALAQLFHSLPRAMQMINSQIEISRQSVECAEHYFQQAYG